MLHVVADLHREDDAEAERREDGKRPPIAHPIDERVPERGGQPGPPERVSVVPDGQASAGKPLAVHAPGAEQVARKLAGEIPPNALALGCGPHVQRCADEGVMNIDVLGGVVRVGGGGEQEFAEAPLPRMSPMDQLVADDENRLGFPGEDHRHQRSFPEGQVAGNEDLPERKGKRRRPEKRPTPDRQVVPEEAPFGRLYRVHVPLVGAQRGVQRTREHEEDERRSDPPAALHRGVDDQRKNQQRQEVGKGVPNRGLDRSSACNRSSAKPARLRTIVRHGGLSSFQVPVNVGRLLSPGEIRSRVACALRRYLQTCPKIGINNLAYRHMPNVYLVP